MAETNAVMELLMRIILMDGEKRGGDCVVYLSAEWSEPVDAMALPYVQQLVQALDYRLIAIQRQGEIDEIQCKTCEQYEVGARCFQVLCRTLEVTQLPACVYVDSSQVLKTLSNGSSQEIKSMNLSRQQAAPPKLNMLSESMQRCTSVRDWLPVDRAVKILPVDDPMLVQVREQANELFSEGNFMDAAKHFASVLLQCPTCTKSWFNLAIILQTMDEVHFAVAPLLHVVELDDRDAVAHTVLREVLHPHEPALVEAGYERILTNSPQNVRARHSLATLRRDAQTAAPEYVQQVFDDLAETFESKLVSHLEYRVPWLLVDTLQRNHALPRSQDVESSSFTALDLGCGTGLCGRLLRPFTSHITGVDLSPLMIEKTREAGDYDELHVSDICPFLASCGLESTDLIIAADVWIYVGELESIFELAALKLRPSKWFAFSVELLSSDKLPFQLASSGRFQHTESYITKLAAVHGFEVVANEAIAVRKESAEAIPGRLFVLQLNTA